MKSSLLRTDEELSQIYHRHVKTVYRVCFMFMKNEHETEDMVQNTFVRLMQDKTLFESWEHEKAWLIRTATNLCKDAFRRRRKETIGLDLVSEAAIEQPFEVDETLKKVLQLPNKYKTVIYMYYYEGYSTPEIAKKLKKNLSTVRSHLHNGRKLLKIQLEGDQQ